MLKSLFWIGATGVALIAGIALHHGDDIQRAGHQIAISAEHFSDVGDDFETAFDQAEVAIDNGADRESSYEDAMANALVNSGLFTLDNIDEISRDEGTRTLEVNDGVRIEIDDVIERAREKLKEAEAAGTLPTTARDISGDDIDEVLDMLDRMDAFGAEVRVEN